MQPHAIHLPPSETTSVPESETKAPLEPGIVVHEFDIVRDSQLDQSFAFLIESVSKFHSVTDLNE